jgi:cell wall-associated NlpC family hydrolase
MIKLHEAARSYLGIPFRHQGRSRNGLDCIGLLVMALRDCGRPVQDVTTYGENPHNGLLELNLLREFGPAIDLSDASPGDLVAIAYARRLNRFVTRHVAVLGDYPKGGLSLIHTDQAIGHVIEHRLDGNWAGRITGVWRV